MKETIKFLLSVSVLSLFLLCHFSCDKDANDTDSIHAGQKKDMITSMHDTALQAEYCNTLSYPIDIDEDGTDDFEMRIADDMCSPMTSASFSLSIKCLTMNAFLAVREFTDTSYWHIEQDTINHFIDYQLLCSRQDEQDSITRISNYNIPEIFNEGDYISCDLSWASESLTLASQGYSIPTSGSPEIVDGVEYWGSYYYHGSCWTVPADSIIYLAAKTEISGVPKLGWIKLGSLKSSRAKIIETGIQD